MHRIGNFRADIIGSFKEPAFWGYSSWLDVIVKYRRTSLGLIWMMLPPFVFMVLLGSTYSQLMGYETSKYLPFLGLGYLLWRIIIQTISESTSVFRNHKSFIYDGRMRLTDYLLRIIAKALFYFIGSLPIIVGVFIWSPQVSVWPMLSLVFTLPVFLIGMLWLSAHLALFGARYPDTAEFTNTILIFAFLVTPILWYPEQAHGGRVLHVITMVNPAAHLIEFVREPMLGTMPSMYTLMYVACYTIIGGVSTFFLYRRYSRYVPIWI
jgi:ABC-type polysaccharide/polyol phosphate export permease